MIFACAVKTNPSETPPPFRALITAATGSGGKEGGHDDRISVITTARANRVGYNNTISRVQLLLYGLAAPTLLTESRNARWSARRRRSGSAERMRYGARRDVARRAVRGGSPVDRVPGTWQRRAARGRTVSRRRRSSARDTGTRTPAACMTIPLLLHKGRAASVFYCSATTTGRGLKKNPK